MHQPPLDHRYTIRRKVLTVLGASFHVCDPHGTLVAFCRQKAFRLREDFRFYAGDNTREELFRVHARHIVDFSATYDVRLPDGSTIASARRKGFSSLMRDSWIVLDADGREYARFEEDTHEMAAMRRFLPFVAVFFPQEFRVTRIEDGQRIATYRTHFNPWVYKLSVGIHLQDDTLDDLALLALGCLVAAIEGRQDQAA